MKKKSFLNSRFDKDDIMLILDGSVVMVEMMQARGRCNRRLSPKEREEANRNARLTWLALKRKILLPHVIGGVIDLEETLDNHDIIKGSSLIICSSITDEMLKYFSENPSALYYLTSEEFEMIMAEVYKRLGYHVQRTKKSRDGGIDLILTEFTVCGEFVYFVECKKYNPQKPLGVKFVRELSGIIEAARVNGGFIATTTNFSIPSQKFIVENKYDCRIKLHDRDYIANLLTKTA